MKKGPAHTPGLVATSLDSRSPRAAYEVIYPFRLAGTTDAASTAGP
jgi:hypothetical protein